jgi:spectinomycin phosphotransferase/16S rRNA (guanine(1405)-N(7))-methyltransferase
VLSRPVGLDDGVLLDALEESWALRPTSASYLRVGAGSYHWRVDDLDGASWFVTVDDLDAGRESPGQSRNDVLDRLAAALGAAFALSERGARFVVAPTASRDGDVVRVVGGRWAVAVYPLIAGEAFRGGQRLALADRLEVVDVIGQLHRFVLPPGKAPPEDDYELQNRADLEHAVEDPAGDRDAGPHAAPLARVLREHGPLIVDMLSEYDHLVARARTLADRQVPTHGEPHAGNTMRTRDGWVLVDWDTARRAAPERDLWLLEPGDGAAVGAYHAATGIEVLPDLLHLFRLRWDLKDLGSDVARLRASHGPSEDTSRSFRGVTRVLSRRSSGDVIPPAAWR